MSTFRSERQGNQADYGVLLISLVAIWGIVPGVSSTYCMLLIAGSMYLLIKSHVLYRYCRSHEIPGAFELMSWYLLWPGLDGRTFFHRGIRRQVDRRAIAFSLLKTLGGGVLLCLVAPALLSTNQYLAGWVGIFGLLFVFHFGLLHFAAVIWQSLGREVRPIMNWPIASTSIAEFWGKRWNTAFRDYAHDTIFRPFSKRYNLWFATMLGFIFSGVLHEIAVSVPARSGFGMPFAYFLLQGSGILLERTLHRRGIAFKDRLLGRLWTLAWVLLPAPIMFHAPFIYRVVVPILESLSI